MNNSRLWTFGGLVLAIAVLVGGYFLGVAPALEQAAAAGASSIAVEAQNKGHLTVLATLRKQSLTIEESKLELIELQDAVPPKGRLSALVNQVYSLAAGAGVEVTSITSGDATLFMVAEPTTVPVPDPAATAQPEASATPAAPATAPAPVDPTVDPDGAGPLTATVTPIAGTGQVAIPITIAFTGSSEAAFNFIDALRLGRRLFLTHDFSMKPLLDAAGATSVEASVIGLVYVLPASAAPTTTEDATN